MLEEIHGVIYTTKHKNLYIWTELKGETYTEKQERKYKEKNTNMDIQGVRYTQKPTKRYSWKKRRNDTMSEI